MSADSGIVVSGAHRLGDDDEEELDGGVVGTGADAADPGDDDEEEIDGGVVVADLFGADNAAYQVATVLPLLEAPRRGKNGDAVCAKRRAPIGGDEAAPTKRQRLEPGQGATERDVEGQSGALASNSSLGGRMLASMGFREGTGLGRNEQGVRTALEAQSHVGTLGLGFQSSSSGAGSFALADAVAAPLGPEELDPCPEPSWMGACPHPPPDTATLKAWLVEGARKEVIDDESEHCDAAILTSMLQRKSALDHIQDRRAFNDARTRANPFEGIKKEFFLNRAALKMAAMDAAFGLLFSGADAPDRNEFSEASLAAAVAAFTDATMAGSSTSGVPRPAPSLLYFGDVAAGPGGFSEYILWRRGGAAKGFGFTLRGEHDFELERFYHRAPPELFHPYYGLEDDGDLYKSLNIRALSDLVRRQTNGEMLHVVMADGGFDVSGLENIQEVMNKQLLLSQCAAAIATLRPGGHFVCKCFDLFTPFSAGLLYLMHRAFEDVCLYKPAQSRPANSERYIVCKGMHAGVQPIIDHLLDVNERLNELKGDWPCGGRVGAAGGGTSSGPYGRPGKDVLRLVPREVLEEHPFGPYLRESNDRLGALQARALERLIAYMRERGDRICDHSATRDDCLNAWRLPPEIPPPPPAHANIEAFFVYEVERGEPLQRHILRDHQAAAVRAEDLQVGSGQSRLRTTGDWVVMEASCDAPPCLVLGADGDGHRGVACVFEPVQNSWRPLRGIKLPAATLLLAEIVMERVDGGREEECVHILDAAMLCGDDVRRLPFAERYRRVGLLVDGLARDPVVTAQLPPSPSARDEWQANDLYTSRRSSSRAGEKALREAAPRPERDGRRVRLKPAYRLHELSRAVREGEERVNGNGSLAALTDKGAGATESEDSLTSATALACQSGTGTGTSWPRRGLLFFPANASQMLPLEPPHEWTKEWSTSQAREYYYNKRTGQSIWSEHRKSKPISFRSSAAAMLRWDHRDGMLPQEKLLELSAAIPEPPHPRMPLR